MPTPSPEPRKNPSCPWQCPAGRHLPPCPLAPGSPSRPGGRMLALGVAVALLLTGCNTTEQRKDAPRMEVDDTTPALVLQMPDGFSNVATKCIPGTAIRVTTIYHYVAAGGTGDYGSVSTVVDETCRK